MLLALGTPKLEERCTAVRAAAGFGELRQKTWDVIHVALATPAGLPQAQPHLPLSFCSFSIMALRACEADVLGRL